MKRIIAFSLVAAAVLMLAACGSKAETGTPAVHTEQTQTDTQSVNPPSKAEYTGIYRHSWKEEIGGTVIDLNSYIILNEDHTGSWIAQDVGTLTWDEGQLKPILGEACDIALVQENGCVNLLVYQFRDDNGEWIPTVFEKIEKLPAEIEKILAES